MALIALLLSLAVSSDPPQRYKNILDPEKLGLARSRFGNPEGVDLEWIYWSTIPAEHIYFPVGAADRRYYVDLNTYNLVFITKAGGVIEKQWIVKTVPMKVEELDEINSTPGAGTLRKILAGYRRMVEPSDLNDRVLHSLNAVKGFAFYQFDYVAAAIWFGYVTPEGKLHRDKEGGDWVGHKPPPELSVPYPVSTWERAALKRMRVKDGLKQSGTPLN